MILETTGLEKEPNRLVKTLVATSKIMMMNTTMSQTPNDREAAIKVPKSSPVLV